MAQAPDATPSVRPSRDIELGLFLVGLLCLMVELLHTRMLAFFLGSISSFLAIPVAMFGLSLGALFVHRPRAGGGRRRIAVLQALVLPVLAAAFVGFFAVSNAFFPVIHVSRENPYGDAARLLAYSGLFVPSYALFGALLASYFGEKARSIGRSYGFDLAGAACGCLLAPLILNRAGLAPAILIALLCALGLFAVSPRPRRRLAVGAGAAAYLLLVLLWQRGSVFVEHPDAARLSRYALGTRVQHVTEMRVRWNDLARTSLVRADAGEPTGPAETWAIVQDDGISNVKITRWDPAAKPADLLPYTLHHALPFVMGHQPKRVLVLFAGVGRDMVELDCLAQGRAEITGVELNPAVVDLYRDPLLSSTHLAEFHARPNIHLAVREGRDFLDHDGGRYDLLFVATNGSVNAERTGETRKYLDTYEAMASYLDHLAAAPGSMLVFMNQPVLHKAESLRQLFSERGLGDFAKATYAFGAPMTRGQDSMVVKPSGLSAEEIAAIERKLASWPYPRRVLYSPLGGGEPSFADVVLGRARGRLVTDDRPFVNAVSFRDFELLPDEARFVDQLYASSWIQVFTILFFGALSVAVMAFLGLRRDRERRLPWAWLLYFLVAGSSYMCVEIGLLGKTELFLGSPLYAVAAILGLFLGSNGLGAYLQNSTRAFRRPAALVLPALAAIAWGIFATELCSAHLLSAPLPLKIFCVGLCVGPAGTFLGMFYPFAVERIVQGGHDAAVPATYAMATLSSVWGSSWAMAAITNLGFSSVILIGAAGYALTGPLYVVARRLTA